MYRPPHVTSERRRTERRRFASAKGRITIRADRGSVETPMSSERNVEPIVIHPGNVPLSTWESFQIKVYQKPDRSLGSDYYLIQREMAKRGKRATATRYMLKVVALLKHGDKYLAAESRGGLTTAIGAISADHYHNKEILSRIDSLGPISGGPLVLRAMAAAFGEAREELRVRPEEIVEIQILPTTVVYAGDRPSRFTVHVFIELRMDDRVSLATLERRRMKDMRDKSLSNSFRETGQLTLLDTWSQFGRRTVDLLSALSV